MPLLRYRKILAADYDVTLVFFTERRPELNQCDVLMVDSKFYKPYWASERRQEAVSHFAEDYSQAGKSIFVDLNDSTGWVVPYVLPYVDTYLKSQLAKDRSVYAQPLYEHRPHSDYYHRKYGVRNNEDIWSQPISNQQELSKLRIGWNSGLANYSLPGPWLLSLYERTKLSVFLQEPLYWSSPDRKRNIDISYRFGLSYPQETLRFQRLKLKEAMSGFFDIPTRKLNRSQYFHEMRRSKIVLSPFGYGEITLKDFETFICGGTLLKPDMDFLETWPNFYQKNKTYAAFSWDMDDIREVLRDLLKNTAIRQEIAQEGQNIYRTYLTGSDAPRLFCEHFVGIIK